MKKPSAASLWQASACLVPAAVLWKFGVAFEGTEFSGARFTGSLLDLHDIGVLLFAAALPLTFFYLRLASGISLLACLLCFPLNLYLTAPGPFVRAFARGIWPPPADNFAWDNWTVAGIVVLTIAALISLRSLLAASSESQRAG